MWSRIAFLLITIFWIVMSALLWRAEFGRKHLGSPVPAAMVWQKILTAPDPSTLTIRYYTNQIGNCQWRPAIGQEFATGLLLSDAEPVEGMVKGLTHYTLDVDGHVSVPGFPMRARYSLDLRFDTNRNWETFTLQITVRPDVYALRADAATETVTLQVQAGADQIDRTFRFSEFRQPQKLLLELGGPMLPAILGTLGLPLSTNQLSPGSLGLNWEAHNHTLHIGGANLRVYRLQSKLLDRYAMTLYVSPVGEILRAELPNHLVLVNDALSGLQSPR